VQAKQPEDKKTEEDFKVNEKVQGNLLAAADNIAIATESQSALET
jgi:hypothetical protein